MPARRARAPVALPLPALALGGLVLLPWRGAAAAFGWWGASGFGGGGGGEVRAQAAAEEAGLEWLDGGLAPERGPYWQFAGDQALSVRWRAPGEAPAEATYLLFARPSAGWAGPPGPWMGARATPSEEPGFEREYRVRVGGLQPGGLYDYALAPEPPVSASSASAAPPAAAPVYRLRVPPAPDRGGVRAWVIGDPGRRGDGLGRVHAAMRDFAGERGWDLTLAVGDLAYEDARDWELTQHFFQPLRPALAETPTVPTFGNHDAHASDWESQTGPYFDAFDLPPRHGAPPGEKAYHSFAVGGTHFVNLESARRGPHGDAAMLQWLEADLERVTGGGDRPDWIVAVLHHPPYSKGSHNSYDEWDLRQLRHHIVPRLEKYGVDLVVAGHSHSYERSHVLLRDEPLASSQDGAAAAAGREQLRKGCSVGGAGGAVYVVTGSASQTGGGSLNHPAMVKGFNERGSVLLEADPHQLKVDFVTEGGEVKDSFRLTKPAC